MLISVITGIAAGAIHVVGGVDHLVAMTPAALRNPRVAFSNGLAWGIGHSTGVLILSLIAVFLKDLAFVKQMSSLAEFIVGIGLLVVGGLAIRTALGLNIHTHKHNHADGQQHDHLHLHFRGKQKHSRHSHQATSIGILHGLAGGSHLLAVFPALALPPIAAFVYMTSYLLGSVLTMGAFLLAISFATMRVGRNAFPMLIGFAGGLSVVTGIFWLRNTSPFLG